MTQVRLTPEPAIDKDRARSYFLLPRRFTGRLSVIFFYTFFIITAIAVFLPLNPGMPRRGIDPSYGFAMNEAVARHLSFGKQIVFTYGPFGSVVTRMYDPATDHRMMWVSLIFGISYILATLYLAQGGKRYPIILLLLCLATFGPGELLLLSYPILLVLCVIRHMLTHGEKESTVLGWPTLLATIMMWAALGVLPVVKGSLVLSFAAAITLPPALLIYHSRIKHALLLFFTPIAACGGLWLLAGQSLADIPGFLRGTIWLISGFAEAMSTSWSALPAEFGIGLVVFYLSVSTVLLVSVSRNKKLTTALKVTLLFLLGVSLFVPFKHGFLLVMGVSNAFASLAVLLLIVQLLYTDRLLKLSVYAVILAAALTSLIRDPVLVAEVHERFGVGVVWSGGGRRPDILSFCLDRAVPAYGRSTYERTWGTYRGAWQGVLSRLGLGPDLNSRFQDALQTIRTEDPVPALKGTTDFYEYDQSVVLATGNSWSPRPVIQSYSAYTPELARLDEEHLRGADAPDWLIFRLQTIDERLPSLDDGMSWPAFLDNYRFVSNDSHFVLMQKNSLLRPNSRFVDVANGTYHSGTKVQLPETNGLLFAEIDMKPTLAGKALTALLNPPQLIITVGLANGETRSYRVVSNMMKTDFLLSPLVTDTQGFASLIRRESLMADDEKVRSISISPSYGSSIYWSGTYELKLKKYIAE